MSHRLTRRAMIGGAAALTAQAMLSSIESAEAVTRRRKRTVVVWSEGTAPKSVYPDDINSAIAEGLRPLRGWTVRTASLNDTDQGLPDSLLGDTNVLIWWGHLRHADVDDGLVQRIVQRVRAGQMGFIATHSAHWSKPFKALMGTPCGWEGGYREDGSRLQVIVRAPRHPIAHDIKDFIVPHTERYTEPFEAPPPQTLIFDGVYTRPDGSTENSRQGLTWTVERGRVFYFQPGHESYPIYFQDEIRHVFRNGVGWVCPRST